MHMAIIVPTSFHNKCSGDLIESRRLFVYLRMMPRRQSSFQEINCTLTEEDGRIDDILILLFQFLRTTVPDTISGPKLCFEGLQP